MHVRHGKPISGYSAHVLNNYTPCCLAVHNSHSCWSCHSNSPRRSRWAAAKNGRGVKAQLLGQTGNKGNICALQGALREPHQACAPTPKKDRVAPPHPRVTSKEYCTNCLPCSRTITPSHSIHNCAHLVISSAPPHVNETCAPLFPGGAFGCGMDHAPCNASEIYNAMLRPISGPAGPAMPLAALIWVRASQGRGVRAPRRAPEPPRTPPTHAPAPPRHPTPGTPPAVPRRK